METNKPFNKPFNLDKVSKQETFSVPDGYFDKLPTIIQAKAIASTKQKSLFAHVGVLKLAIPFVLLLVIAGYLGYKYQNNVNQLDSKIELMLVDVSTEELVEYLDQSDLSSEDFLELVSFEGERIDDFSNELKNVSDEELELLLNDFEIEDINNI